MKLRNLCDLEYYGRANKTMILFFSRCSAETSQRKVKPLDYSHGVKQQGNAELQGTGRQEGPLFTSGVIMLCCAVETPGKHYFSIVFLHPVFVRSGCLEPLALHLDREIYMTNFKLVNCS